LRLLTKELPKTHKIALISDVHIGSRLAHVKGLVNELQSLPKNTYIALGGDLIEAITIKDKRYSPEVSDFNMPLDEAREAIAILKPFKNRILYTLAGNHENLVYKQGYGNLARFIADELGVEYGTYTTKLTVKNKGRLLYKVFHTHGHKGIGSTSEDPHRAEANMQFQLKKHLYKKAGDCLIMVKGHTHKLIIREPMAELVLYDDGQKIRQTYRRNPGNHRYIPEDLRWYVNTGSWLKSYDTTLHESGYAEEAEYDPIEIGYAVIECIDGVVTGVKKKRIGA